MGNLFSSDGKLPSLLRSDLDATLVDVGEATKQMLQNKNHVMNPAALGVYKNVTKAHGEYVRVLVWDCLNFAPGKVLSGGGDGCICVWDDYKFIQLGSIDVHNSVRSLCVTPGCWLSGHSDGLVVVWDVKTHREITRLDVHSEAVYALLYIPRLNCVVTGAERIAIWEKNAYTFDEIDYLDQEVLCIASVDNWVFTGQMDSDVGVWEMPSRQSEHWKPEPLHVLRGHTRSIWALVVVESRGLLASGSADSSMRIWTLAPQWECVCTVPFDSWVTNLSFGGNKVVSSCNDGTVKVWNVDSWKAEKVFQLENEVYAVLIFRDGRIASGGAARSIVIYCESRGNAIDLDKTFKGSDPMQNTTASVVSNMEDSLMRTSNENNPYQGGKSPKDNWVNPFDMTLSEFQVVEAVDVPENSALKKIFAP